MNTQIEALVNNIEKIIVGKRTSIVKVICAMLSEGHILIEDVPGVGKTRLVSALASSVDGKFNRIQLTPDIMPSDIVGFSMINPQTRELEYKTGAAMCNFLLADEINRASPKAQSSLLEVMEEHQISLDGVTMRLPAPFMVMATQNPVETYGTYHLPEAQMDRFIMKISMGYPTPEEELDIISRSETNEFTEKLAAVMTVDDVMQHIASVKQVRCTDSVKKYIVDLLNASRSSDLIKLGASPRAGIALLKAAKAYAYIDSRDYVVPDDVKAVMSAVLSHRLMLSPKGKSAFGTAEEVMEQVALTVPAPVE
ncbi:MoxR-like ATPase [Ruminococcus sp. YE71]|uniref:AAA family ATPase n=1 Tax=unclassified Ruminococcus TaxID=2608920 RepID=UPI00088E476F|nr:MULTISPECIES: MoxR family ATPase [unclassified Ruminococcus]SDA15941.1 MoxR-like ATPase [Ruminococcus sp. YE78]SFW23521.1 MoxR-like ATPase [Ruminococcus sp. YE71]